MAGLSELLRLIQAYWALTNSEVSQGIKIIQPSLSNNGGLTGFTKADQSE